MVAGSAGGIVFVFVIPAAVDRQVCGVRPDEALHEKLRYSCHTPDAANQNSVNDQGGGVAGNGATDGLRKATSSRPRYTLNLLSVGWTQKAKLIHVRRKRQDDARLTLQWQSPSLGHFRHLIVVWPIREKASEE